MAVSTDIDTSAVAGLWEAYAASREPQLRERLVSLYLPFARMMAARMYGLRTHANVEFDDYLQYGRVGLLEAIERYDASRGFKFETYAASRINGAILSGMEAYSEVHEQVAARRRAVQARLASLAEPQRAQGAPADLFGYLAELAVGLAVGFALEDSGMYQAPEQEAHYRDHTYDGVELKQLRERIKALLDGLPGKHKQVVSYHYLQQLPFHEIAEMMQLTKGRIAQLHKEALLKLREGLRATRELDWSG
ncbi:sigma-70 family RNA polymerase sigma factor [Duganella sp. HH101]|uniref:sigma-70 family RNA polymerase sigma factor n=1 Tax=Duganella sp. HH101 TaxID=1781066 RepID=UPI0008932BDC|nr:sigma-70 family RNA polymerase sigma factor [Duganella sp. HH101]OFA06680.1 RNA polymerase sigma factor FliA [Duganella sp. HH101]